MQDLLRTAAPTLALALAEFCTDGAGVAGSREDFRPSIRSKCVHHLDRISHRHGRLTQALEGEGLKLHPRLAAGDGELRPPPVPLFRVRHVHSGVLLERWSRLVVETEDCPAEQGHETLFDAGPWGGFDFVVEPEKYPGYRSPA